MKRRAFKLLLFLLLIGGGAIINVAVAWGCALWSTITVAEPVQTTEFETIRAELIGDLTHWRATLTQLYRVRGAGREEMFLDSPSPISSYTAVFGGIGRKTMAGWPMLAVYGCDVTRSSPNAVDIGDYYAEQTGAITHREWMQPRTQFQLRQGGKLTIVTSPDFIPARPLWPGFAINTIFYALLLWALFAVPGYIKRKRRIKRGLCSRCAYPVGVGSVCSECGTPVHPRNATHWAAAATPARDYR